jgi:hypothetical protein
MQKIKSGIKHVRNTALAGLAALTMGCASMVHYIEPKVEAVIPIAAEKQAYTTSFAVGADYGFYFKEAGLGIEAGLDYFQTSGEFIKTDTILPRAAVNFSPFEIFLKDAAVKPYVSAGVSLLNEFSTIDIPDFDVHEDVRSSTLGIDVGLGATLFDCINARVGYTFLPTSENAKGLLSITGSYRFLFQVK